MGLFSLFKKKENLPVVVEKEEPLSFEGDRGLSVLLEALPSVRDIDRNKLIEITDPMILSRVDSLVPAVGMTGISIGNAVKQSAGTLYKVVLSGGGELVDSRAVEGAKRAISMGKDGIAEHANLFEVKPDSLCKAMNVGASVFNVASMIVGQYYMQQVDTKIAAISACIKGISETLEIEYKSKVASLIESVYNVSKYQVANISNEELREHEISNIQELRKDCQTLLNQAEEKLGMLIAEKYGEYKDYENAIQEIEKWRQYQAILMQLLYQINTLDFALYLGRKTKEHCFGSFELHKNKEETLHNAIVAWHNEQCDLLKIDVNEAKRKQTGLLGLLEKPIGLINKELLYKQMGKETIRLIKSQIADLSQIDMGAGNRFEEDVEIYIMDGKKYYLPKNG